MSSLLLTATFLPLSIITIGNIEFTAWWNGFFVYIDGTPSDQLLWWWWMLVRQKKISADVLDCLILTFFSSLKFRLKSRFILHGCWC
jgi:hypothetical protein